MSPFRSLFLAAACAATLPLCGGTLTYANDAGRQVTLRRDGAMLVLVDGRTQATLASAPAATTDRVVIRGAEGEADDTLRIDLAQPISLGRGIDYDGGAGGWDVLELAGGSARVQRITQLTPHDGVIDIDGLVIRYTNLEPITDTAPAASLTISGTAGTDSVTFADGPGGTTTVSAPSFESVTFANKTSVVFDGVSGNDVVTFDNPNPATGLTSLIVTNVERVTHTDAVRYASLAINARGSIGLIEMPNDVDRFEATSQFGQINLWDADDVIVGGVSPDFAGIRVTQTGGISVQSVAGTITLADTDGAEVLRAGAVSGDIGVYTNSGDVTITVDRQAMIAPAGWISIFAWNNVLLGTAGATYANDVRAALTLAITAGDAITIGGLTTVEAAGLPENLGAVMTINGFKGTTQQDGARFVTTGAGANIDVLGGPSLRILGAGVEAQAGEVFLLMREIFELAPSSAVLSPEIVTIFTNGVTLGAAVDAPGQPIEISDAEVDRVTAPVLRILANESITIAAPITFTTGTELILMAQETIAGPGSASAQVLTFNLTNFIPSSWIVTPASVQIGGSPAVPYTAATLNVNPTAPYLSNVANTANDTISVAPSATTVINIDGNLPAPPASPGDTLDFDLAGVASPVLAASLTPDGYQGSLTSGNRQPVNFREIETLVDAPVDLGVTKTDGRTTVPAGAPLTYTIVVSNAAPVPVVGAAVGDVFPPQLTGVTWTCSASSGSACTSAGSGNLNDTVTIAANGSVTYTVAASTSPSEPAGPLNNTATVAAPTGYTETNTANDSATDTTAIAAEADLLVEKTASARTAFPGGEIEYTITLRNAGPSDTQSVVLEDVLPGGTSFVSLTSPAGYSCTTPAAGASGTVTCTRGTLPPSATPDAFTLVLAVNRTVPHGTTITNSATAASTTTDPASNNTASAAVPVGPAEIPTLSTWMLGVLAALLVLIAVSRQ